MQVAINSSNKLYRFSSLKIDDIDNEYIEKGIENMTYKERLLNAKSLILVHKKSNRVICELNMIHN